MQLSDMAISFIITWFWLRLSSITWQDLTAAGISVTLFRDKSTASRLFKSLSTSGNDFSPFPVKLKVLRWERFLNDAGNDVKRLFSNERVSNFLRFPISSGKDTEKENIFEPLHDKKNNKMIVCPAKTQISLGIQAVLSLCWVHIHNVGFVMWWLNYALSLLN